jgi:hypothetical protein
VYSSELIGFWGYFSFEKFSKSYNSKHRGYWWFKGDLIVRELESTDQTFRSKILLPSPFILPKNYYTYTQALSSQTRSRL